MLRGRHCRSCWTLSDQGLAERSLQYTRPRHRQTMHCRLHPGGVRFFANQGKPWHGRSATRCPTALCKCMPEMLLICREQISGVPAYTMQQGSLRADAAPAAKADSSSQGCGRHSPPTSLSQTASVALASARTAHPSSRQQGSQDRGAASDCQLKAGVHGVARRTKRAAQLTRLKGTLRRAKLPKAALGAALAGAAQDASSTQSATAASAPASPEQNCSGPC